MYKTSLTYNGYSLTKEYYDEKQIEDIKKELTVSPKINSMYSTHVTKYILYKETDKKIYLPRCYGLSNFGIPNRILLNEGKLCERLEFKGNLREVQLAPVNAFIEAAKNPLKRGGIISVQCAGGKTVMALYIACALKKKTMFIHHKDFLGAQFIERANTFVPDAKIGIIKQNRIDVEDKDFIVASLQSLAKRDYPLNIFEDIGLVIIDECHHTSAEVFSKALLKIVPSVMLGLSATLDRKDGLRKVFEWFIGKSVLKEINNTQNDMVIKTYQYYADDENYHKITTLWNGQVNIVKIVNNIANYVPRTKRIIEILKETLVKEPERKVLILSERKAQLKDIENELKDYDIGYYVGGMKQENLKKSESKQIILATFQMASEGMDIPALNTLLLATPVSSIEQSIGRIQRELSDVRKYIPLTIDIVDDIDIIKNRFFRRLAFYKKKKYTIESTIQKENYNQDINIEFIEDDNI
jgi:superfamily II DNA or RNA helicase